MSEATVTMPLKVPDPFEVNLKNCTLVVYPTKMHQDALRRFLQMGIQTWLNDIWAMHDQSPAKVVYYLRKAQSGKSHWTVAGKTGKRAPKALIINKGVKKNAKAQQPTS